MTGSLISTAGPGTTSASPPSNAPVSFPAVPAESSSSFLSEGEMGESGNKTSGGFELMRVRVVYLPDEKAGRFDVNDTYKALHLEIIATMKELLKSSYFYKEHFDQVQVPPPTHRWHIRRFRAQVCRYTRVAYDMPKVCFRVQQLASLVAYRIIEIWRRVGLFVWLKNFAFAVASVWGSTDISNVDGRVISIVEKVPGLRMRSRIGSCLFGLVVLICVVVSLFCWAYSLCPSRAQRI